ncbi:hypothetical protein HHK36_024346 [Tetracentron sinense]|uniref:Uncharacterized protein n=1 Tax=Tetracentron sinense TaxID=13715 RepID=A0A834YPL8_TETSI|nr:hypothetical protein HHK36_024346 [Tetracentron sinense]
MVHKPLLILFILLISIFLMPSEISARKLAETPTKEKSSIHEGVVGRSIGPKRPICSTKGRPYRSCIPATNPKTKPCLKIYGCKPSPPPPPPPSNP